MQTDGETDTHDEGNSVVEPERPQTKYGGALHAG
jgi:hypothetical protein